MRARFASTLAAVPTALPDELDSVERVGSRDEHDSGSNAALMITTRR
jgi:hypothetical protein